MTDAPNNPSENPACRFPQICARSLQCENWLRFGIGCKAEAEENETRDKITKQ